VRWEVDIKIVIAKIHVFINTHNLAGRPHAFSHDNVVTCNEIPCTRRRTQGAKSGKTCSGTQEIEQNTPSL
jgi:hypothetical protein